MVRSSIAIVRCMFRVVVTLSGIVPWREPLLPAQADSADEQLQSFSISGLVTHDYVVLCLISLFASYIVDPE